MAGVIPAQRMPRVSAPQHSAALPPAATALAKHGEVCGRGEMRPQVRAARRAQCSRWCFHAVSACCWQRMAGVEEPGFLNNRESNGFGTVEYSGDVAAAGTCFIRQRPELRSFSSNECATE